MGCFATRKSAAAFISQLRIREGQSKEMPSDLTRGLLESGDFTADDVIAVMASEDDLLVEEESKSLPDLLPDPTVVERFLDVLRGSVHEKSAIKRENGIDYPARDFAFVPDATQPSTWKLRLTESPGKVTVAQLARATAALSSSGFRGNRVQIPSAALSAVKRRIRAEYRRLGVAEQDIPSAVKQTGGFDLWKQADGRYRWFAIYSNAFRDSDLVPEIIAKESHELFVEMVDEGLVPYPELWHYHVPGTRWGVTDWVGFSEGFALASGTVDVGHEKEAEALAARDDIGVSHGMPGRWIVRDQDDPTVIVMHVTSEISPLPMDAAANKLTGFMVKESEEMALSDAKKEHFRSLGFSEETIASLESNLKSLSDALVGAGVETKEETTPSATPVAAATPEPPADPEPEPDPVPAAVPANVVTREEVAEALKSLGTAIIEQIGSLTASVAEIAVEVKSLKEADETKVAKQAAATPAMSLNDMVTGLFSKDAKVDGRSALAKSKPEENKEKAQPVTGIAFIDSLIQSSPRE